MLNSVRVRAHLLAVDAEDASVGIQLPAAEGEQLRGAVRLRGACGRPGMRALGMVASLHLDAGLQLV